MTDLTILTADLAPINIPIIEFVIFSFSDRDNLKFDRVYHTDKSRGIDLTILTANYGASQGIRSNLPLPCSRDSLKRGKLYHTKKNDAFNRIHS